MSSKGGGVRRAECWRLCSSGQRSRGQQTCSCAKLSAMYSGARGKGFLSSAANISTGLFTVFSTGLFTAVCSTGLFTAVFFTGLFTAAFSGLGSVPDDVSWCSLNAVAYGFVMILRSLIFRTEERRVTHLVSLPYYCISPFPSPATCNFCPLPCNVQLLPPPPHLLYHAHHFPLPCLCTVPIPLAPPPYLLIVVSRHSNEGGLRVAEVLGRAT